MSKNPTLIKLKLTFDHTFFDKIVGIQQPTKTPLPYLISIIKWKNLKKKLLEI